MNFRERMKIANEQNARHQGNYFFSCLVMTTLLCLIPILFGMFNRVQDKKRNMSNGLRGATFHDVIQVDSVDYNDEDWLPLSIDYSAIPGLMGYGELPEQGHSYIFEECFPEVCRYIRENSSFHHLVDENGTREMLIQSTMWEVLDITLESGYSPREAEGIYADNENQYYQTYFYYYGSDFEDKLPIGTVRIREANTSQGTLLFRYIVAGYLKKGSRVFTLDSTDFYAEGDPSTVLDKQFVKAFTDDKMFSTFLVMDGTRTKEEVEKSLRMQSENIGVYWIEDEFTLNMQAYEQIFKVLLEMAIIILSAGICLISLSEIIFLLGEAQIYGIWYSCGMKGRDLVWILCLQNVRRMRAPIICGAVSSWLTTGILSERVDFWNITLLDVKRICLINYPMILGVSCLIIIMTTLIPWLFMRRKTPSVLLRMNK